MPLEQVSSTVYLGTKNGVIALSATVPSIFLIGTNRGTIRSSDWFLKEQGQKVSVAAITARDGRWRGLVSHRFVSDHQGKAW